MLAFHRPIEQMASVEHQATRLEIAKQTLLDRGMASMDQYGDMLQWGLDKKDGFWHKIHVYHPDWCSWSDRFRGTIHFHGGRIKGTVLVGHMEHYTYHATTDPTGDRFYAGERYHLDKHTNPQGAGTTYELPAMVPHWLRPTRLTLTYFEEEDTDIVSDLVEPATQELDEHKWTQQQADALLPELLERIDEQSAALRARPSTSHTDHSVTMNVRPRR